VSAEGWASFRMAVLADPVLQQDLLLVTEREPFCALVVKRAHGLGWDVELGDVDVALRASMRAWLERWI